MHGANYHFFGQLTEHVIHSLPEELAFLLHEAHKGDFGGLRPFWRVHIFVGVKLALQIAEDFLSLLVVRVFASLETLQHLPDERLGTLSRIFYLGGFGRRCTTDAKLLGPSAHPTATTATCGLWSFWCFGHWFRLCWFLLCRF